MKKLIKDILSTLFFLVIFSNLVSYLRSPTLEKQELPIFREKLLDHTLIQSKDLKKRPLILYFWATWCSVCSFQSPVLTELAKEYQVLSISFKSGTDDQVRKYMQNNQLQFPVLNDPKGDWGNQFKISHFPTILLYTPKGKLYFTDVGYTSYWGLKLRLWFM